MPRKRLTEEEAAERKAQKKEYMKNYRKEHPEKFRKASSKWRKEHKDMHNECQKRHYRKVVSTETREEKKQRLWNERLKRRIRKFDKNVLK